MRIFIGTILLIWSTYPLLRAQYHQTYLYTIADGLPMTECERVSIDREGYLWVGSTAGHVSRFDGRRFEQMHVRRLLGAIGSGAQVDKYGVWYFNQNKDKAARYHLNEWHVFNTPKFVEAFLNTSEDEIALLSGEGVIYHFDSLQMTWIERARVRPPGDSIDGCKFFRTQSFRETSRLLFTYQKVNEKDFHFLVTTNAYNSIEEKKSPKGYQPWMLFQDKTYFRTHDNHSLIDDEGKTIQYLPYEGLATVLEGYHIPIDNYRYILIKKARTDGSHYEIVELLPSGMNHSLFRFKCASTPISATIDSSGTLWVASHSGLLRVEPGTFSCFENHENMVPALHTINQDRDDQIWFGSYTDGFAYYSGSEIKKPIDRKLQKGQILPGSFIDDQKNMYFFDGEKGMLFQNAGKWEMTGRTRDRYWCPPYLCTTGYYFLGLKNEKLAVGLSRVGIGITTLPFFSDSKWKFVREDKGLHLVNVLTIAEDKHERLWLGRGSQGIAIYDQNEDTCVTYLIDDYPEHGFGAISSHIDDRGNLWLGSPEGLRFLQNPHLTNYFEASFLKEVRTIKLQEELNSAVSYLGQKNEFLIFGSLTGHGFLDLATFYSDPHNPRIFFYNTEDPQLGGSSEQNTYLEERSGKVWIGKDRGAARLDFDKIFIDTLPVKIRLDSLKAGNELVAIDLSHKRNGIKLPLAKRNMMLWFQPTFTGHLTDNVGYRHRLLHSQDSTEFSSYSTKTEINFNYLPPGRNDLEIVAIKNNQIIDRALLPIFVPRTLAETPLFWIGLVGFIGLLGAVFLYNNYQQKLQLKSKELEASEANRQKERFQIQAITSSLNPHLINNSLSWIQARLQKDPEGMKVVDRLAENIETVFLHSRSGEAFHSLKDEMRLVENYLQIQQARYGGYISVKFPKSIILEKHADINVPLMQLLIHVENAIEHGIRNDPEAKSLEISLSDGGDHLHFQVIDEGIGRARAREIGSKGTQQGTQMLKNLHRIFNAQNEDKIKSWYEDEPFTNQKTKNNYGTVVHIIIPKKYNYDLTN